MAQRRDSERLYQNPKSFPYEHKLREGSRSSSSSDWPTRASGAGASYRPADAFAGGVSADPNAEWWQKWQESGSGSDDGRSHSGRGLGFALAAFGVAALGVLINQSSGEDG